MPERNQHESQNLSDYEVDDAYDTLDGEPGDDPLDRGVVPPERWSAAIRSGAEGESLDDLLAEEEPDTTLTELEDDEAPDEGDDEDENAGDEDNDVRSDG